MSDTIENRKVIGGTQVLVNGRFVGWKCCKCDWMCPFKGLQKYDLCRYGEVVKGASCSFVTPLGEFQYARPNTTSHEGLL